MIITFFYLIKLIFFFILLFLRDFDLFRLVKAFFFYFAYDSKSEKKR